MSNCIWCSPRQCLGPLLFLVYINDLGSFDRANVKPKLFADDTNVFVCSKNISELNVKSQDVIDKISAWISANRLTLNAEKTFYMVFSPKHSNDINLDLNLFINNSRINRAHFSKFLGVIIDDNLSWKFHIQDLCLCLRRYVGIFYKLSLKLPPNILKMLYFAIIYPRILYGIEIYANTYSCNLHDLMILNNRILRILQHRNFHTCTLDLYISYNTLPIDKLFKFQMLIHAHNIFFKAKNLPNILLADRLINNEVHDHYTRSTFDFHRLSSFSTFGSKLLPR